jgi:hypothetical protein
MKRSLYLFLFACTMAFTLTLPAKPQVCRQTGSDLLPGLDTAQSCCTGADRQRCTAACGGRAYCDLGACLCACPAS